MPNLEQEGEFVINLKVINFFFFFKWKFIDRIMFHKETQKSLRYLGNLRKQRKKTEWKVNMRLKREGIYVYIWLIHFIIQQKLTQYCKAIILQ